MTNREEQMIKIHEEAFSLFKSKNKDYGDAFAKYGPVGVIMRMSDKISRLQILLLKDSKNINYNSFIALDLIYFKNFFEYFIFLQ